MTSKLGRSLIIFAIAAWSGFFVMSVELLSSRLLAPSFGNSIYVWGGVITVFMLALSVGYLIGGHLSLYAPSIRRLGLLLAGTGASLVPVVFFGEPVLDFIFERVQDPRYGSLLASSALFFLPTVIAGTVSPYAVRLLVSNLHMSGRSAGFLYFVSTLGSAAGTIITSFYLVLLFEINQIFTGLIGLCLLLGLAAAPFGRQVNNAE